jgi:glycosyltransferase involved in cell wall biosynthesis
VLQIGVETGDLLRPHRAGMARYTYCLLTALARRSVPAELHAWSPWRRVLGWMTSPVRAPMHFFGNRPPRQRPDIFHATACVFPAWKSPIEVATVHDLYAVREELQLPAEEVKRRTEYIHRADRVICVSQHTRNHLHALLNIPPERTVAIPLAVEARFAPASQAKRLALQRKWRLPAEFLLFVGRARSNKNLERLIAAYALSGVTMPLCIVGAQGKQGRSQLMQLAITAGCADRLRWLGAIAEDDLPVLLSCASALCMPSTFEGFGLPIIEAMACGTPVLTSAGRATEEAAGGQAVLVDPHSVESIADGLIRALQVSDSQRAAAREYAVRRNWDDVAAETWRVYESAAIHR